MNLASIIILLAVAAAATLAVKNIIKRTARSSSNCTGCPLADRCVRSTNRKSGRD